MPDETVTAIEDDPSDNMMLEAGVAGDADYIVSGDQHLLEQESYRGIAVVDPSTFLTELD